MRDTIRLFDLRLEDSLKRDLTPLVEPSCTRINIKAYYQRMRLIRRQNRD